MNQRDGSTDSFAHKTRRKTGELISRLAHLFFEVEEIYSNIEVNHENRPRDSNQKFEEFLAYYRIAPKACKPNVRLKM